LNKERLTAFSDGVIAIIMMWLIPDRRIEKAVKSP
jgi:hypothetical protein